MTIAWSLLAIPFLVFDLIFLIKILFKKWRGTKPSKRFVFTICVLVPALCLWLACTKAPAWYLVIVEIILMINIIYIGFIKQYRTGKAGTRANAGIIISASLIVLISISPSFKLPSWNNSNSSTSPSPSASTSQTTGNLSAASKYLLSHGWKSNQFTVTDIDKSKDKSTTADGAFNKSGAKDINDLVAYLSTGSDSARTVVGYIAETTKQDASEVLNPSSWVAVQSLTSFSYPANTLYENGKIIDAGKRDGENGDVFFLFMGKNGIVVPVRGACVNPQKDAPVPKPTPTPESTPVPSSTPEPTPIPTPTPTYWWPTPTPSTTPKSSNPGDYVAPALPQVTVTGAPEETPPDTNSGKSTNTRRSGSSGSTIAPGANPEPSARVIPPQAGTGKTNHGTPAVPN